MCIRDRVIIMTCIICSLRKKLRCRCLRSRTEYEFVSVKDMQEWILLLQKLVRALENSKPLHLCKKRSPEC